jgi:hypothetical protein
MNSLTSHRDTTSDPPAAWMRVSSSKPYIVCIAIISLTLLIMVLARDSLWPLVLAGPTIALGLMALNWKVVYRRGNEYRVSTLFYTEVVTVDDVCMTVKNSGPIWTRIRIHLRRPTRFGWMITYVPANPRATPR